MQLDPAIARHARTSAWNVSGAVEKAGAPLILYGFKTTYKNSLFSWKTF